MSGILGRFEPHGVEVDGAKFSGCLAQLKMFGPDRTEQWVEGPVAVGRQLLRLSPASQHEKPVGLYDGLVVATDAILDDREQLGAQLGLSSEETALASDTDLIARSYRRWGAGCVERLLGDFAFAVIDPARDEVFLARDHIGSRPLFWSARNSTILFGSSVAGILAFTDFTWRINERTVAEYLTFPLVHVSGSFFEDVHAVQPGYSNTIRAGRSRSSRWWRPSFASRRKYNNDLDVIDATRRLLNRAIADRTVATGNVGAHLSGGVDSTGITALAARALKADGRSLKRAYAWSPQISEQAPDSGKHDERHRIALCATREGVPITYGAADGAGLAALARRPMELEGQADLVDEIALLSAIRDDHVRVVLSGWGGDEVFSSHGQGHLAQLILTGKVDRAKRFAKGVLPTPRTVGSLLRLLWSEGLHPLLPQPLHDRVGSTRKFFSRRSFIRRDLVRRHQSLAWTRPRSIRSRIGSKANMKAQVAFGHIAMRMETWAAWSAEYNFQYRYPLTDRRLLEFLFALPPQQLYLDERPRGLALRVLSDCLPDSASKLDVVNERVRTTMRDEAWQTIANDVRRGAFDQDCPWLDMPAFREQALTPAPQNVPDNVIKFAEVFAAVRIWHLYQRAEQNNWL